MFDVTAINRLRAIELGAKLLDVPRDEVQAKLVRERLVLSSSQIDGRTRPKRYRVSLKPIDGHFMLTHDGSSVLLQVREPKHGGKPVIVDQVMYELDKWPVGGIDVAAIRTTIDHSADWTKVHVASLTLPENAPKHGLVILVTSDEMRAFAVALGRAVYEQIHPNEIESALQKAGVVAGVLEPAIARLIAAPNRNRPVEVAHGQEAEPGQPAAPEWLVPVVPGHNGEPVPAVKIGQPIARLRRATLGRPGMTVLGHVIEPRAGASAELASFAGTGVSLALDGQYLLASTVGKPTLDEGKIAVLPVSEVATVDKTCSVHGNLIVHQAGESGAQIEATGHVEIHSSLHNANVRAGGSILVTGSAIGKSVLTAGTDVLASVLQGGIVKAGGIVRIGMAVIQGTIWAGQRVLVTGKGHIDGGLVRAGHEIIAETIGNEDGKTTRVVVSAETDQPSRIIAWRRVYPGTIVRIGHLEIEIDETLGPTVFEVEDGQISTKPLVGQRPIET